MLKDKLRELSPRSLAQSRSASASDFSSVKEVPLRAFATQTSKTFCMESYTLCGVLASDLSAPTTKRSKASKLHTRLVIEPNPKFTIERGFPRLVQDGCNISIGGNSMAARSQKRIFRTQPTSAFSLASPIYRRAFQFDNPKPRSIKSATYQFLIHTHKHEGFLTSQHLSNQPILRNDLSQRLFQQFCCLHMHRRARP